MCYHLCFETSASKMSQKYYKILTGLPVTHKIISLRKYYLKKCEKMCRRRRFFLLTHIYAHILSPFCEKSVSLQN